MILWLVASACGSVNDRRRTAGGKPADYSASGMPLVTSALGCGRNRRGREGHRADRQPVMGAGKRVGHGERQATARRAEMSPFCFSQSAHWSGSSGHSVSVASHHCLVSIRLS